MIVFLLWVAWLIAGDVIAEEPVSDADNTVKTELTGQWAVESTGGDGGCDVAADNEHIGIEPRVEFGRLAPVFTLPDIDDLPITLSEFRGRDILLVFGGIKCPHCAARVPLLNELDNGFDEGGFKVIFVALGSTAADAREYIENKNIKFDVLLDRDGTAGRAYGVRRVPEVFLIDSEGIIQYCGPKEDGAIWNFLAGQDSATAGAQMGNCEKRGPYLLYQPTKVVKPNEDFTIEIFVDFSDCPPTERTYHVDLNADGIYEISGRVAGDSFLIRGNFLQEGIHPVQVKVEDGYGTTHSLIDVYITQEEKTIEQVRKELYPRLYKGQLDKINTISGSDGIRKRRVVLFLGSAEERFWIDINLAYHVLKEKYNFTDEEIILITYDRDVPASLSDFDVSWIDDSIWTDGTANLSILQDTFQNLSTLLDGDDLLFFVFDGHGSGYYGPRTRRPYFNGPIPHSVYEGPIDTSEYDDPDYKEDEFQTELIPSGRVNCLKYDGIEKGMDKFAPCFDYYPYYLKAGDSFYRFKVVSHFSDLPLIDGSTVSDNDIYIEKIISYAKCDLNRNTIIEANEVDLCDWDGDGTTLMSMQNIPEYDEDDWYDRFSVEDNYHPYSTINGLYYCFVDRNLDNTLELIGFDSSTDPLYLDCLAGQANPNDLKVTGSDSDNNGYANYLDINLDDDLDDYLSFDERLSYGGSIYDDELASLFSMIDPNTTKIFLSESCFSGGFLRDLSYHNVISMSASEEDDTSSGNYFIRHFFMALNTTCEQFGSSASYPGYDCNGIPPIATIEENLDWDGDDLISIAEAFRKSYEIRVSMDFPMFDDNADLEGSYGDELTYIHELGYWAGSKVPEGIYGDSTFLDKEFSGDVNQVSCFDFDGPLNFSSLSKIAHYGNYYPDYLEPARMFDYVCDGRTNEVFARYLSDFDDDHDVDFADFGFLASAWLTKPGDGRWNSNCDITIPADNAINKLDLAAFADNWLASE